MTLCLNKKITQNIMAIAREQAIKNIWRKEFSVGDKVYGHTVSSDRFFEGVAQDIDTEKNLVVIDTISGAFNIPADDVHYVQLLCADEIKACKSTPPACLSGILKAWSDVEIGDRVLVSLHAQGHNDVFAGIVAKISWQYGYVGLTTVSGITFAPLVSFDSITVLNSPCPPVVEDDEDKKKKKKSKKSGL